MASPVRRFGMVNDASLNELRAEIDGIDNKIQDLLIRRTEIVARIGAVKRESESTALALRPGREAEIVRRLVARHRGPFPLRVLVHIWREILSAQVALQSAFSVAVFAPDGALVYRDLARAQYGSSTAMTLYRHVSQLIKAVTDGEAQVGVLPMPYGERPDPWWLGLISDGPNVPRVIAQLPFLASGDEAEATVALAIACAEPEPTGDDTSLIGFEISEDLSRDRLRQAFRANQLDARWIGMWHDPVANGRALHLVAVDQFITRDDSRLAGFRQKAGNAIQRVRWIGAYARPLTVADKPA